jgi:hypothetical protein
MPSLDDLPTLATVSSTGDDLLPVYDLTATGSSKVRKLPLNSVMGLAPTGELATDTDGGNITIATRVQIISGSNTSTLTLPAASGVLREVIVINDATGTATISPNLAAGTEAIVSGASARLLSNGTGWYRVG